MNQHAKSLKPFVPVSGKATLFIQIETTDARGKPRCGTYLVRVLSQIAGDSPIADLAIA